MSADFYFWLRFFDAALMLIGVALNYPDRKMLLLTVTVGAGVLMPLLPTDSSLFFYSQCLFIDLFVMLMAIVIKAGSASVYVAQFGLALSALHVTGMVVGPVAGVSLYNVSIPLFEISQLLTCLLMSEPCLRVNRIVKYFGRYKNG